MPAEKSKLLLSNSKERSLGEQLAYLDAMKTEIQRLFQEPWHREGVRVCCFALDWAVRKKRGGSE